MPASRRRRPWLRRIALGLTFVATLLVVALVAAWLSLPWLVRRGFETGARSIGSDEASITVTRADLSGLHVSALAWRLGGLGVTLDKTETAYSIGALVDGRIADMSIDGLAVTLDFTKPRRGMLPDAIEDLVTRFSSGGDLIWPIDHLALENCRLILALPEGSRTISMRGAVTRLADGRIDLELRASDPDQDLVIHGAIRTETLDGELSVERLSLHPETVLAIIRQLGVAALPEGMEVDIPRIDASGTATLKAGNLEAFSAQVSAPTASLRSESMSATISALQLTSSQTSGGTRTGTLAATISAADAAAGWALDATSLRGEVRGAELRARLEPATFRAGESTRGRVGIVFELNQQVAPGTQQARVTLTLDEMQAEGLSFAPVVCTARGWTDRIEVELPRLALAAESPLEIAPLRATFVDPLGDGRVVEATAAILAGPSALAHLPEGWSLTGWDPNQAVAEFQTRVSSGATGPEIVASLQTSLPELELATPDIRIASVPTMRLAARGSLRDASLALSTEFTGIREIQAGPIPLPETLALRLESGATSLAALQALGAGQPPGNDIAFTFELSAQRGAKRGSAKATVSRPAGADGWRAVLEAATQGFSDSLAGLRIEEGAGSLSFDTGVIPDASIRVYRESGDTASLIRELAPRCTARLAATASAIEQPGAARIEWASLELAKPAATEDAPPMQASLRASAGILRTGPETIEQPSLALDLTGDLATQRATARISALVEGTPLTVELKQDLVLDLGAGSLHGRGDFELQPFALANSDIASRWAPDLKGTVVSARLDAQGTLAFGSDGSWDGTAHIRLADGVANYPAQSLRVDGLFAEVEVESLASLRTAPTQRAGFSRLTVNDIAVSDGWLHFRTDSASVVHVEGAGFGVFDGLITAEPFSLYFPDADVALDLRMKDLDAGSLVRTFDLFDGSLTGRLQGRLPIGLLAGRPIIGEGFLELQPEHPARLSVNTGGIFTSGLPDRTALEKVNRLPHELLEDGLADLQLRHFRIDLFRRDQPGRPIEMRLGGVAHTQRADVPIELQVNLNGSAGEVIDMLLQLLML